MFMHQEDGLRLLTDTLATDLDGHAVQFQCKFYALPQLRMLMAGTGLGQLAVRWHEYLHTSMLSIDAEMLHKHAPTGIRSAWESLEAEHGPFDMTGTIYHFGMNERGRAIRYVYRSTDGFVGERHTEPGFGIKPVIGPKSGPAPQTVDEMIKVAIETRAEQDALPADPVYIGGELILASLTAGGCAASVVYRFDDYGEMWNAMNDRPAPPHPDDLVS